MRALLRSFVYWSIKDILSLVFLRFQCLTELTIHHSKLLHSVRSRLKKVATGPFKLKFKTERLWTGCWREYGWLRLWGSGILEFWTFRVQQRLDKTLAVEDLLLTLTTEHKPKNMPESSLDKASIELTRVETLLLSVFSCIKMCDTSLVSSIFIVFVGENGNAWKCPFLIAFGCWLRGIVGHSKQLYTRQTKLKPSGIGQMIKTCQLAGQLTVPWKNVAGPNPPTVKQESIVYRVQTRQKASNLQFVTTGWGLHTEWGLDVNFTSTSLSDPVARNH